MTNIPSVSWQLIGALAALGSALMWAISAILFRQLSESMSAAAMNLIKGVIALFCIGIFLIISGFSDIDTRSYLYLALSGILGICIGDTLYFQTLARLGARLTLLLGSMIPVTTAVFAVILLHERPGGIAWLGVLLTISGVTLVLWDRSSTTPGSTQWRMGLILGAMFVLANAAGIILTKVGVSQVAAMHASFVRTLWAVVGLSFWGLLTRELISWVKPIAHKRNLFIIVVASVIGAFIGTWLSVVALKYTDASIAATLNSTSPVFILPLSAWLLKERVTFKSITGAVVAVAGVGLYFSGLG